MKLMWVLPLGGGSQFYDKDIKSINKESVYNVTHTTDSMSPSYLVKLF